jgi:signal transduction histidine kinase
MARIEHLEADAERAIADLECASDRLASSAGDVGTSADRALALVRPLADRVRAEAGGSVPLILHADFSDLEASALEDLFDQLEVLAQDLQLIVLCDREEAASWASGVGLRRALGSQVNYASV